MQRIVGLMSLSFLLLLGCESTDTEPGPPPAEGTLGDVLECGQVGVAGGLGSGTALQRFNLDLETFPDARCNDGTAGFFYFRPSTGGDDGDRWLVQLQGGGACTTPDECFSRWCSAGTNFGMQGMTANESPEQGTIQPGILRRRPENPFGGFNQVFIRYCSSDLWSGSNEAIAQGAHPLTGAPVTATVHFRGYDILTAVLDTLRGEGPEQPVFTLDGGEETLPDLDQAQTFVLAGASAGGQGVLRNLDRVRESLRGSNPDLTEFGGLVDSATPGSASHYDFTETNLCLSFGLCTYEEYTAARWGLDQEFRGMQLDASCVASHPGAAGEALCNDSNHLATHHLTAPFLVRMGQRDENLVQGQLDVGYLLDGAPLTLNDAAAFVREDLAALADPAGNEEAASYSLNPAVFSPTCSNHEVLSDEDQVYDVTIELDGEDLTMFELLLAWRGGLDPAVVIASSPADNVCP